MRSAAAAWLALVFAGLLPLCNGWDFAFLEPETDNEIADPSRTDEPTGWWHWAATMSANTAASAAHEVASAAQEVGSAMNEIVDSPKTYVTEETVRELLRSFLQHLDTAEHWARLSIGDADETSKAIVDEFAQQNSAVRLAFLAKPSLRGRLQQTVASALVHWRHSDHTLARRAELSLLGPTSTDQLPRPNHVSTEAECNGPAAPTSV